jgi:hypothetical protein
VKLRGNAGVAEPAVFDAVDDVAWRRLSTPFDHISFGRVNDDGTFFLAVPFDVRRILVVAEDLESGHESALAAVVRPDQHCQPGRRFNDRLPMRHEVVKFNPCDHCTAVREVLLPATPRRACSAQSNETCSSLHHSVRKIAADLLAVWAFQHVRQKCIQFALVKSRVSLRHGDMACTGEDHKSRTVFHL